MDKRYKTKRLVIYEKLKDIAKLHPTITQAEADRLLAFASLELGTSTKIAQEVFDKLVLLRVFEIKEG